MPRQIEKEEDVSSMQNSPTKESTNNCFSLNSLHSIGEIEVNVRGDSLCGTRVTMSVLWVPVKGVPNGHEEWVLVVVPIGDVVHFGCLCQKTT